MAPAARWILGGLLGLSLIASSAPAGAQLHTSPEERFFKIAWELESTSGGNAALVGALSNHYFYPLREVWLQAQVLDETGQSTHQTLAPVADVPAGGSATFRVPLPATGTRYVVTVHAFEFGQRAGEAP